MSVEYVNIIEGFERKKNKEKILLIETRVDFNTLYLTLKIKKDEDIEVLNASFNNEKIIRHYFELKISKYLIGYHEYNILSNTKVNNIKKYEKVIIEEFMKLIF